MACTGEISVSMLFEDAAPTRFSLILMALPLLGVSLSSGLSISNPQAVDIDIGRR